MKRKILIADDVPVIRHGLRSLVDECDDLAVGGEAGDGHATLELVRSGPWALVVLELSLPGRNGLELIKLIKASQPGLPVLVFSAFREELYAVRAIRAGASGYLLKNASGDVLLAAIRALVGGSVFFSQNVSRLLVTERLRDTEAAPHTRLTDREYGIFSRIITGARLMDIADELSLSIKTVSTHKANILEKMTLGGQVELVHYAIAHKLLDDARMQSMEIRERN